MLAVRTPPRQVPFSNRDLHWSRSRRQRDERAGWCSDQEAFSDENVERFAATGRVQIPETAGLSDCDFQTGHFQEFAADTVEQRRRDTHDELLLRSSYLEPGPARDRIAPIAGTNRAR